MHESQFPWGPSVVRWELVDVADGVYTVTHLTLK